MTNQVNRSATEQDGDYAQGSSNSRRARVRAWLFPPRQARLKVRHSPPRPAVPPVSGHGRLGAQKKTDSRAMSNLLSLCIFLLGIGVSLYPYVAQQVNNESATKLVAAFNEAVDRMPSEGGSDEATAPGVAYGAPDDDMFGSIFIPSIDLELPIYVGSTDENLSKGVAHMEGTSLPVGGESTHTVLAGHSYTVTNEGFTRIERMETGDLFYIRNSQEVLTYCVISKKIIQPSDTSHLLIERDRDLATLLTCTASGAERVIVTGERVMK